MSCRFQELLQTHFQLTEPRLACLFLCVFGRLTKDPGLGFLPILTTLSQVKRGAACLAVASMKCCWHEV